MKIKIKTTTTKKKTKKGREKEKENEKERKRWSDKIDRKWRNEETTKKLVRAAQGIGPRKSTVAWPGIKGKWVIAARTVKERQTKGSPWQRVSQHTASIRQATGSSSAVHRLHDFSRQLFLNRSVRYPTQLLSFPFANWTKFASLTAETFSTTVNPHRCDHEILVDFGLDGHPRFW